MPVTMGYFYLEVLFPSAFPINVQEHLLVMDNHVHGVFHPLKGQTLTVERQAQTDRRQQNKIFLFLISSLKNKIYIKPRVEFCVFLCSYYAHPEPTKANKMNSNCRKSNQNKGTADRKIIPRIQHVNYSKSHICLYGT